MGHACGLSGLHASSKTRVLFNLRSPDLKGFLWVLLPDTPTSVMWPWGGASLEGYAASNSLDSSSALFLRSLDGFICWLGSGGGCGCRWGRKKWVLPAHSFMHMFSVLCLDNSFWSQGAWYSCSLFLQCLDYRRLLRVQMTDVCEDMCGRVCHYHYTLPHTQFAISVCAAACSLLQWGARHLVTLKRRSGLFQKGICGLRRRALALTWGDLRRVQTLALHC